MKIRPITVWPMWWSTCFLKEAKSRSARDIADEMTAIGGNLDAYTSKECTCYYTRTLGEYADKALEIIADMLIHSKIDPNDLKKELGVILDEIDMYEDDADEQAHELLQKEVWGDHPLGYIISGEKETVRNFTCDDVRAFMEKYYTGEHMVISVAGSFDENQLLEAIQKYFGTIPSGSRTYGHVQTPGCVQTSGDVKTPGCGQTSGLPSMPASCQGEGRRRPFQDPGHLPPVHPVPSRRHRADAPGHWPSTAYPTITEINTSWPSSTAFSGRKSETPVFSRKSGKKKAWPAPYTLTEAPSLLQELRPVPNIRRHGPRTAPHPCFWMCRLSEPSTAWPQSPSPKGKLTLTKQQIRTELLMATRKHPQPHGS